MRDREARGVGSMFGCMDGKGSGQDGRFDSSEWLSLKTNQGP